MYLLCLLCGQLNDTESWEEIDLRKASSISKFLLGVTYCSFTRFFAALLRLIASLLLDVFKQRRMPFALSVQYIYVPSLTVLMF